MHIPSEELLDLLAHAVFVLKIDEAGVPRYHDFCRYGCERLKMSKEEIVGLTAKELYPGRFGAIAFEHHCKAARTGLPDDYQITLPLAGQERTVRTSLRPRRDDDGNVRWIVGSSSDISDRQTLNELRSEMQTIHTEMEEFVHFAAHDLRTPVRMVKQIAELLRDDFQDLGDGKMELINALEQIGDRSMALITDVLSGALSAGTEAEIETFDFCELMDDIFTVVDPLSDSTLIYEDAVVSGDRTVAQIAIRNLVDNSVKYAKERTGMLQLEVSLKNVADDFYEVSVKDNGCGFSDPALAFLANGKLRMEHGFGLSAVRRLVRSRGWKITVANRVDGPGACVTLTLPGSIRCDTDTGPQTGYCAELEKLEAERSMGNLGSPWQ